MSPCVSLLPMAAAGSWAAGRRAGPAGWAAGSHLQGAGGLCRLRRPPRHARCCPSLSIHRDWPPGLPAITVKWRILIKKGNISQNPSARRGVSTTLCPQPAAASFAGGPWQQSGRHRHMGGTGGEAESQRESSLARVMLVGVAAVVLGAGVGCDFAAVAPGGSRTRLRRRARVRAGGRDN